MALDTPAFWLGLLEVIWVNILLSGDNAVVIALAARSLPESRQVPAIALGAGAAVVLRVVLTLVAAELLLLPWLKVVGGFLLLYIGISLVLPDKNGGESIRQQNSMLAAIRTIIVADLVMSLDNVVAVAAAANGSLVLLILGLGISIPLVVFGSALLLKVTERFPFIVWVGGALIGYIAGEMLVSDPGLHDWVAAVLRALSVSQEALIAAAGGLGAVIVLATGKLMGRGAESDC
ncbi:MAG: TerC family protein [Castellaniella sp.]|uniref:YjbE family putative metal transport protein n=1 Tax=Castellaniella sp. TaxID=1955812 RepID=UPI001208C0D4|nr:YjbE family putative metal transport protein [Castellaniella sp.]TAN29120.1 MAG: TerC family protein [Castellaniella sp.]